VSFWSKFGPERKKRRRSELLERFLASSQCHSEERKDFMPVGPRRALRGEFSRRSLSVTVNVRIAGNALPFRGQLKTALASRGYAGLLTIKRQSPGSNSLPGSSNVTYESEQFDKRGLFGSSHCEVNRTRKSGQWTPARSALEFWRLAVWMRLCAVCKAILRKPRLCDSVRCQCGWIW
jgi:hypothetical protein